MGSFDVLRAFFEAKGPLTDADFNLMQSVMTQKSLAAEEFLARAGEVATHAAFITKGCLRSYTVDPKGKEHIVSFAPETHWLADSASLMAGEPSQYFFQAIEDTDVLLLDGVGHQRLVNEAPAYADAFRTGLQKHAAAKDRRIVSAMSAAAKDRYLEFLETYPSLVTRVPQWMLASYLGISPETLSRIRKNLSRAGRQRGPDAVARDKNQPR